jgi:hypothetical protein
VLGGSPAGQIASQGKVHVECFVLGLHERRSMLHGPVLTLLLALAAALSTRLAARSMNLGHRVKSVTLADYSAHEVEQMQQGGNQVCCWLVRLGDPAAPAKQQGQCCFAEPSGVLRHRHNSCRSNQTTALKAYYMYGHSTHAGVPTWQTV